MHPGQTGCQEHVSRREPAEQHLRAAHNRQCRSARRAHLCMECERGDPAQPQAENYPVETHRASDHGISLTRYRGRNSSTESSNGAKIIPQHSLFGRSFERNRWRWRRFFRPSAILRANSSHQRPRPAAGARTAEAGTVGNARTCQARPRPRPALLLGRIRPYWAMI